MVEKRSEDTDQKSLKTVASQWSVIIGIKLCVDNIGRTLLK